MNSALADRLNDLPMRLLADDVRHGKGLGNELGFFIFDYSPEYELEMRSQLPRVLARLKATEPTYRVVSINILMEIKGVLEDHDLLGKAIELERELGPDEALEAIRNAATAQDVAARIVRQFPPESTDLYLVHGVGSSYPFLRAHALLSNLHSILRGRPLVLFFPGRFTGRRLVLFGKLHDDHYYRAFRLFQEPC